MSSSQSGRGLTRVGGAGVEQCVGVGDKLQLSVQVSEQAAGQRHVHLAVAFDLHAVHLGRHVQGSQRGADVDLQRVAGQRSQQEHTQVTQPVKLTE